MRTYVSPQNASMGVDSAVIEKGLESTSRDATTLPRTTRRRITTADAIEWMAFLDDNIPLSALTIPGTHDSAAYTISWPFVSTQKMDILTQLDSGIRYFDLRCGLRENVIEMVHGPTWLGLTLQVVLATMYSWLEAHSTEALLVQIKQDREASKSTIHFAQAVFETLTPNSHFWRTGDTTPTVGDLRGRIQLFRRFNVPMRRPYGLDVTRWQDNPERPFTIFNRHNAITIQDHYSFRDPTPLPDVIETKAEAVGELLTSACGNPNRWRWYINFTSASEFNWYYQFSPREVAVGGYHGFKWQDGINVRLRAYLTVHPGHHRLGITAMDFPELGASDLIVALIQANFPQDDGQDLRSRWLRHFLHMLCIISFCALWLIVRPQTLSR